MTSMVVMYENELHFTGKVTCDDGHVVTEVTIDPLRKEGITPVDALRAAIGGCVGATLVEPARSLGIDPTGMSVEVETIGEPLSTVSLRITVLFPSADSELLRTYRDELHQIAASCTVMQMIRACGRNDEDIIIRK